MLTMRSFRARRLFLPRILTDTQIRRSSDCAPIATAQCWSVLLGLLITLTDQEKLDALRRLDRFRHWHSLDERRYCLVCGEMITGHKIRLIGDKCDDRQLRPICPTEHCDATPIEWVQPTEDVLIRIAMVEFERQWLRLIVKEARAMRRRRRKTASSASWDAKV